MGIEDFMISGKEENMYSFLNKFFDKDNVELKSEITDEETAIILEIAWHNAINKEENKTKRALQIFLDEIVPLLLKLKVSRNRQSRKEAEKILSAIMPTMIAQETSLSNEIKKV